MTGSRIARRSWQQALESGIERQLFLGNGGSFIISSRQGMG